MLATKKIVLICIALFFLPLMTEAKDKQQTKKNLEEVQASERDRRFNVGFSFGSQRFTDRIGNFVSSAFAPGVTAGYFLTKRWALFLNYTSSTHGFDISNSTSDPVIGDIAHSSLGLQAKYYFDFDPFFFGEGGSYTYFIGGISSNSMVFQVDNVPAIGVSDAIGTEFGFGMEFPVYKKLFIGIQGIYRAISYDFENRMIKDSQDNPTGVTLKGDELHASLIFGATL